MGADRFLGWHGHRLACKSENDGKQTSHAIPRRLPKWDQDLSCGIVASPVTPSPLTQGLEQARS